MLCYKSGAAISHKGLINQRNPESAGASLPQFHDEFHALVTPLPGARLSMANPGWLRRVNRPLLSAKLGSLPANSFTRLERIGFYRDCEGDGSCL